MKILFVVRSAEHFSRYTSILRSIISRGHKLNILFDRKWSSGSGLRAIEEFKKQNPSIDFQDILFHQNYWRKFVLLVVRSLWTYRIYLVIENQSSFFKTRWRTRHMPVFLRILVSLPFSERILKTKFIDSLLRRAETSVPPSRKIVAHIKSHQPDAIVV